MAGRSDFTEQEWESVLEGATSAGLFVSMAARGGTFRESFSLAKGFADARADAGASELLDEIARSKPKVDRPKAGSGEELRERLLENVREAISVLGQKASPEEIDEYRSFTIGLAERVAGAKTEEETAVSPAERAAIDEVAAALGPS